MAAPAFAPDGDGIAHLLGLSTTDLVMVVRSGIPFDACDRLRNLLGISPQEMGEVLSIPDRTMLRRKHAGHLTNEESDRVMRLARIFELAMTVFDGNVSHVRLWLQSPKSLHRGETPLEHCDTEPGAREVEDMLYAIEFTMPA